MIFITYSHGVFYGLLEPSHEMLILRAISLQWKWDKQQEITSKETWSIQRDRNGLHIPKLWQIYFQEMIVLHEFQAKWGKEENLNIYSDSLKYS